VDDPAVADVDARVVGVATVDEQDDVAPSLGRLADRVEPGLLLVRGARDAPTDPAVGEHGEPGAVEGVGPGRAVPVRVAALGQRHPHGVEPLFGGGAGGGGIGVLAAVLGGQASQQPGEQEHPEKNGERASDDRHGCPFVHACEM
jgi:hypothetical protein